MNNLYIKYDNGNENYICFVNEEMHLKINDKIEKGNYKNKKLEIIKT